MSDPEYLPDVDDDMARARRHFLVYLTAPGWLDRIAPQGAVMPASSDVAVQEHNEAQQVLTRLGTNIELYNLIKHSAVWGTEGFSWAWPGEMPDFVTEQMKTLLHNYAVSLLAFLASEKKVAYNL